MITIQEWKAADKTLNTIPADEALSRRDELLATDNVLWIDLTNPSEDEERLIFQQFFPVHALSLEDVTRLRREPDTLPHLPKVEEFSDYLFVIVNPLAQSFRRDHFGSA